jgi:hypothetical protein
VVRELPTDYDEDVAFLLDLLMLPMPEGRSLPNLAPARKKQRILEALNRRMGSVATRRYWLAHFSSNLRRCNFI